MPPKKRKATKSASIPTPNKRATRSSTRTNAPNAQTTTQPSKADPEDAETSKPRSKASRKSKSTKPSPKPEEQASTVKKQANDTARKDEPSSRTNVEPLTINSDLVKKPILCEIHKAHTPSEDKEPTMIYTHGAGGTLSAAAVVNYCAGFSESRSVLAFQGSMNLASRVKGFRACIEHLKEENDGKNLVLAGRSMGARAAVMAATEVREEIEDAKVQVVLVSYPLKGPKDDLRDGILFALPAAARVLFIIGDRDAMCPIDTLNEVRSKMEAKSQLVIVRGADHGMHTKPASAEKEVGEETGRIAASWLAGKVQEEVSYIGEET